MWFESCFFGHFLDIDQKDFEMTKNIKPFLSKCLKIEANEHCYSKF